MMEINKAVELVERALPESKSMALRSAWQALKAAVLAQQTQNMPSSPKLLDELERHLREAKWVNEDFLIKYPRCLAIVNQLRFGRVPESS
jgi:hypothetical protein